MFLGIAVMVRSPFPEHAEKTVIQSGNTGEEFVLDDEEKWDFLKRLSETETRVSGIRVFSAGYHYKITFLCSHGEKEIIVKSSELFESGGFMYKTDRDLISLIESVIS